MRYSQSALSFCRSFISTLLCLIKAAGTVYYLLMRLCLKSPIPSRCDAKSMANKCCLYVWANNPRAYDCSREQSNRNDSFKPWLPIISASPAALTIIIIIITGRPPPTQRYGHLLLRPPLMMGHQDRHSKLITHQTQSVRPGRIPTARIFGKLTQWLRPELYWPMRPPLHNICIAKMWFARCMTIHQGIPDWFHTT